MFLSGFYRAGPGNHFETVASTGLLLRGMDYLAFVGILHPGPVRSLLRPAFAALAPGFVMVVMACGGYESPGDSSPLPASRANVQPTVTSPDRPSTPEITASAVSTPQPPPTPLPLTPTAQGSPSDALNLTDGFSPDEPTRPGSTDVLWPSGDGLVGGTLTIPAGWVSGEVLPAVLLVADGGGADRDWVSPSIPGINGSGRLLAAAMADEGYITLRYDSRGTGRRFAETAPLPGENRLGDSVNEVSGAIEFLASRPEVDRDRIFVVAHDEGALYVLLRERQSSGPAVAGIALLSPSGLTLRQQVIRRLGKLTTGPGDEPLLGRFDAAMAFFIEGTLPDSDLGLTPSLQMLFDNLSHPLNQPYISEIWNLDIVSLLPEIKPPVLVLIGQADSELDWPVDGGKWEEAVAPGQDVQFAYPARADHVLKLVSPDAASGNVETGLATYNVFGRTLDGETVDVLLDWLNEKSGLSAP